MIANDYWLHFGIAIGQANRDNVFSILEICLKEFLKTNFIAIKMEGAIGSARIHYHTDSVTQKEIQEIIDHHPATVLHYSICNKNHTFAQAWILLSDKPTENQNVINTMMEYIGSILFRIFFSQALLTLSNAASKIKDEHELQTILDNRLLVSPDETEITIIAFNQKENTFRNLAATWKPSALKNATADYQVSESLSYVLANSEYPLLLVRPQLFELSSSAESIPPTTKSAVLSRLTENENLIGYIVYWSKEVESIEHSDMPSLQMVSSQVCIALTNILHQQRLKEKDKEKSILLFTSSELAAVRNKEELFKIITTHIKSLFKFKGFAIGLINHEEQCHHAYLFDCDGIKIHNTDFEEIVKQKFHLTDGFFDRIIQSEDPVHIIIEKIKHAPEYVLFWKRIEVEQLIALPMRVAERAIGVMYFTFDNMESNGLQKNLMKGICAQLAVAIANSSANEQLQQQLRIINEYKEKLEEEKVYLQSEVLDNHNFDIIGNSDSMKRVFQSLSQVAASESTVLILGETGTGKELIARAIHNASPHKNNLLVKLNCSAIPANLIESELFGHEKGSFTGAIERRIGKFELANHGTLFLDEIGEMPVDMQAKLLRALQEREIERVGGKATIKVSVRIVAATNRNLEKEVTAGNFRSDLYYRLNVFPITLPALQERKQDIPLLVNHFIDKIGKKLGKKADGISEKAMNELMNYNWPGNVRELEHVIERSLLLSRSSVIKEVPLVKMMTSHRSDSTTPEIPKTLEENERDHIMAVLHLCGGRVFGKGGTAEILGINRSTLVSRMRKLGIVKDQTTFRV